MPLLSDISHFDSTSGEHFPVEQQQLQSKADSNHQNYPSVTKMTQNQAYSAHIFGSGDPQLPLDKADSQQQQSSGDTKMTQNLAYNIFGFDGLQQLPQDEPSYEQVEVCSAMNVVCIQSYLPLTSNQAYGVLQQQEHNSMQPTCSETPKP